MHNAESSGRGSDEAAAFARQLAESGLSGRELEEVLTVGQSTVSRLLNARICDVRRHVAAFERRTTGPGGDRDLDDALAGLAVAARRDPALRRVMVDLYRLMQNA